MEGGKRTPWCLPGTQGQCSREGEKEGEVWGGKVELATMFINAQFNWVTEAFVLLASHGTKEKSRSFLQFFRNDYRQHEEWIDNTPAHLLGLCYMVITLCCPVLINLILNWMFSLFVCMLFFLSRQYLGGTAYRCTAYSLQKCFWK